MCDIEMNLHNNLKDNQDQLEHIYIYMLLIKQFLNFVLISQVPVTNQPAGSAGIYELPTRRLGRFSRSTCTRKFDKATNG